MSRKQGESKAKPAGNRGKGRPKGSRNKTTTALKEAILLAAEEHGFNGEGDDGLKGYLRMVAGTDVKAFASLLGKVLPMTVAGDPDNPVIHKVVREIVKPSHSNG